MWFRSREVQINNDEKPKPEVEYVEYAGDSKSSFDHAEVAPEALEDLGTSKKDMKSLIAKVWGLNAVLGWTYMIMFTDKYLLSTSAILGIKDKSEGWLGGLDMTKNEMFSWTSSAYYLGYLVAEVPLSFLVVKKCGTRYTGIVVLLWGIVIACSSASQSYAGYVVCRVLLGAGESIMISSFQVTVSQFFPKHQHFGAGGMVWTGANGITIFLVNAVGYGLITHNYPIASWRIAHIIFGLLTVLTGILYFFIVPNTPDEAWFLTEPEKRALLVRLRDNQQGFGDTKIKWYQVLEPFTSEIVHTALILGNIIANCIIMGAMTTFQNSLINQVVSSKPKSLLMTMPGGAFQLLGCWGVGAVSLAGLFSHHRFAYMLFGGSLNVMCCCLISWGPNDASQLVGLWMWNWVAQLSYGGMLSMVTSNITGHTKKITVSSVVLVSYSVANLVGPQLFTDSEKEAGWPSAKEAIAALSVISFVFQIALLGYYVIVNRRRDVKYGAPETHTMQSSMEDLTDGENKNFRYAY